MRYIGLDPNTRTVVQIDGNKSAYVNVKSFGASGLDNYFSGSVSGTSGNGDSIYINQISNYTQYEEAYFVEGREITAFFLTENSAPDIGEYGSIFTSAALTPVGAIQDTSLSTARNIEYFIFPYNVSTGKFSPYVLANAELSGLVITDPKTDFDEANYVQITFSRSSSNWVPVIYRRYNGRVDFLGVIGNSALQTSTSVTFYDRGTTQIPSWDEAAIAADANAFLPEFLTTQISLSGTNGGPVGKAIVGKKRLKIISKSQVTGVVEFADADNLGSSLAGFTGAGTSVKFKFDDTKPIQDAIEWAKVNFVKNVFFPTGTYNVSHIKLYSSAAAAAYSDISLFGTGASSIIKKGPSVVNGESQYGIIGILGSGVSNRVSGITIKDLAFDGNKKESMKKAIKDKKGGCSKCEGECECDDKKSDKKEEVEITKDDVIAHLVENNYTNNEVSAEVLFTHISDEFLENIEEDIKEAYQQMSPRATQMSKRRSANLSDQEYAAAGTGDEKKTNNLMQKKIKVMDARSRHGARG